MAENEKLIRFQFRTMFREKVILFQFIIIFPVIF